MFLQHLRLENVRSLEDVEFDFCNADGSTRQWTLLLGENGCGKSSVLRAAALVLAGTDALPELIGPSDAWIRNSARSCRISARLVTQKREIREVALSFKRGQSITQILIDNAKTLAPLTDALEHTRSNYPTIGYGASRRLSSGRNRNSSQQGYFSAPRANAVATLFATDAPLNPLDTWAMDLHYREKAAGLKIVKETLAELLPGIKFHSIDRKAGELIFDTPDGRVPLQQLSDGYQNMAGWCGDLLYRLVSTFGHRRRPLATRGLLLVDEIDLHLHPVWQRQLRSFLSNKLENFQVLATTHSPLTAQQSGEGEIFTLERNPRTAAIAAVHFTGAASLLTAQQVLTSPAFGLETILSTEMQQARSDWKTEKAPAARALLVQRSRPSLIPPEGKTHALMARIERELGGRATKKVRAATAK